MISQLISEFMAKKKLFLISAVALLSTVNLHAETVLIKNANVHTLGTQGLKKNTDVLIKDGVIVAFGDDLSKNEVDLAIDGTDKHLTPGIMAVKTQLGIVEIDAIDATADIGTSDVHYGPSFDVAEVFNPNSTLIPQNKNGGITRTLIAPQTRHSLFAGKGAVMSLSGEYNPVLVRSVGIYLEFGEKGGELSGGSRASALLKMKDALNATREYMQNSKAVQKGEWRDLELSLNDMESLVPLIEGKTPLIATVHRASDMLALLRFAKREKIRLIIDGASEAWMIANELEEAGIPVIIDPMDNLPDSFEKIGVRLNNAALLHRAGVKLLFAGAGTQGTHNAYLVRQAAGNAVANGLRYEAAMEALFLNPAEVFGSDKPFGKIEPGYTAELVLWDGDPLEVTTEVDLVIINGKTQSLVSRSTRLRERYINIGKKGNTAYLK